MLRRLGVLSTSAACLLVLTSGPAAAAPTPTPSSSSPSPSPGQPTSPAPTPSQSTSYQQEDTDFALTVSPARLVVGQQDLDRTQQVTVVNRGRAALDLQVQLRNFAPKPDGSLAFEREAPYAAASWLTVSPQKFVLEPGTSRQVTTTVDVPSEPEPGDHHVALVFLVPNSEATGNVRINRGVAAPVYVSVPGPTDDTVQLRGLRGPRLVWEREAELSATLENTGNTHRDFRGPAALSLVDGAHSTRFSDFTVARGSVREVSSTWRAPLVCVCRPTLSFANASGAAQTASVTVVVLPWWLAAGVLAVALLALLLGLRARRRARPRPTGTSPVEPGATVIGDG
jgi:hypothetical protein